MSFADTAIVIGSIVGGCIIGMASCSRVPEPSARADAPLPPPVAAPMTDLGQLDGTTWVKHDNVRRVTCWVYSYTSHTAGVNGHEGGISCIPDSQLEGRGAP